MWIAVFIASAIGFLFVVFSHVIFSNEGVDGIFPYIFTVVLWIFFIFASAGIGIFIERKELNEGIEAYIATKYTIETSLENIDLTGLERIELVKQASEKNEWLARQKYDVQQWYKFYLDKDKILELEMINLDKGE